MAKLTKQIRKWWKEGQNIHNGHNVATKENELDLYLLTWRDFYNCQRLISNVIQFLYSKWQGKKQWHLCLRDYMGIKKGVVECIRVII